MDVSERKAEKVVWNGKEMSLLKRSVSATVVLLFLLTIAVSVM